VNVVALGYRRLRQRRAKYRRAWTTANVFGLLIALLGLSSNLGFELSFRPGADGLGIRLAFFAIGLLGLIVQFALTRLLVYGMLWVVLASWDAFWAGLHGRSGIAPTTRTKESMADATAGTHVETSAGAMTRGSGRAGGLLKVVVIAVLVLVPIIGAVGYYAGRQNIRGPLPTWTDREIRATGTQNVGTLRCTYHMADGTVRVRETMIALSTNDPNNWWYNPFGAPNPLGARTPDCPQSP